MLIDGDLSFSNIGISTNFEKKNLFREEVKRIKHKIEKKKHILELVLLSIR